MNKSDNLIFISTFKKFTKKYCKVNSVGILYGCQEEQATSQKEDTNMLTIKKWILENYEVEETELEEAPTKSKENYYAICSYVMDMFMREKLGVKANPGEVNKYNFYDWAQSLPGILNTSDIFLGIEGIRKVCFEVFGTLEGFKEENRELYEKKIIGLIFDELLKGAVIYSDMEELEAVE